MASRATRSSRWFETQLDSDHIWARGFPAAVCRTGVLIDHEDAGPLPAIIAGSAWGTATRDPDRPAFPFSFEPLVFSGGQYCDKSMVPAPLVLASGIPDWEALSARGAWVGDGTRAPSFTDTLEMVVTPRLGIGEPLPATIVVAQVLFDLRHYDVDPFVVAATRVLEPLIADLRSLLAANAPTDSDVDLLRQQVERLSASLRDDRDVPSRMRTAIATILGAIGGVLLNILANRLDDGIPWDAVWTNVHDALRRLGLG